jgi:triosephosphate isomerase
MKDFASSRGPSRRPLVGVSLKMYFSMARTTTYLYDLASLSSQIAVLSRVDTFVLPDFLSLPSAQKILSATPIMYGAQDCMWKDSGPYTGSISPASLREIGCSFVELGHAERRVIFAESNESVALKASAAARNGLVPLICVGEISHTTSLQAGIETAVQECRPQVLSILEVISPNHPIVFAYEPVWAIGQPVPASPAHIVGVAKQIRAIIDSTGRTGLTRILYGGSAGPGLFYDLRDGVDGLFLGRFGHDVDAFRKVIEEVAEASK